MTNNKFEITFLDLATKLDASIVAYGEIKKYAIAIVEKQDESAIKMLINIIAEIVNNSSSYKKEILELTLLFKDSLINYVGYIQIRKLWDAEENVVEDKRSLEELLTELNKLIGLESVKNIVNDLIVYQTVQQMRRNNGLNATRNTLHMAFTGNPGTGKTTVARIVGHVYKKLGLLSKGHFIEASRTDLIAGYQGQTALKVKKVIERAKGGVLFIDEAYSITENDHSDSYGRECLTELTKALEDNRDDLVVIVAGYTEPMNKFFESNPGLKSRFNTFIEFSDFTADELTKILVYMCDKNDYEIDDELKQSIQRFFEDATENKGENFANARLARNIYENLVMAHARRIIKTSEPTKKQLSLLKKEDLNKVLADRED